MVKECNTRRVVQLTVEVYENPKSIFKNLLHTSVAMSDPKKLLRVIEPVPESYRLSSKSKVESSVTLKSKHKGMPRGWENEICRQATQSLLCFLLLNTLSTLDKR